MKIIKWLTSKAGKVAISTAQAVGIAAVGVVGLVTWQALSSPDKVNSDSVFSSNDEEITYVSGQNAGGYAGYKGGDFYGEGGHVQSGIRVAKSVGMKLQEQDDLLASSKPTSQVDEDEQQIQAYQMGQTEGLGMGRYTEGTDVGAGIGPGSVQDQIAAIAANVEQKKKEAEEQAAAAAAAAGAEAGDVVKAAAEATGSKSGRGWGNMNSDIKMPNGNAFGTDAFAPTGVKGRQGLGGSQEANRLAAGSRMNGADDEHLRNRYKFKNDGTLKGMQEQAEKMVGRKDLAVNQGSEIFMNGTEKHGDGIRVDQDAFALGGAESLDGIDKAFNGAMGAGASGEAGETYEEGVARLSKELKTLRDHLAGVASLSIIPGLGAIIYHCMQVEVDKYNKRVDEFKKIWENTVMEQNNTKGAFTDNAKKTANEMFEIGAESIGWPLAGTIASIVRIMQTYDKAKDKYFDNKQA